MTPTASTRDPGASGPQASLLARRLFLFGAPVAGVLLYAMLPGATFDQAGDVVAGLPHAARATAAIALVMAMWWLSEAMPLEAVSLVPLALFPPLGIATMAQTARPYAQDIIFLFLGGMLLGQAVERWGLHRRAALVVVNTVGASPGRLIAGLLVATAFISMWVSNTAAAVMMLPIATSVAALVAVELERTHDAAGLSAADQRSLGNLAAALILAVAFGASIGGVGTLIGTPPMAQMAGFIQQTYGHPLTFLAWFKLGLPVLAVFIAACWISLRCCFPVRLGSMPGVRQLIRVELDGLGPANRGERATLIVFAAAAVSWIAAPLVGSWVRGLPETAPLRTSLWFVTRLSDAGIAIAAALALFILPATDGRSAPRRAVLTWNEASRCPWGILILFGGGLSLAEAVKSTGLDGFIAGQFAGLAGMPVLAVMFALAAVCIVLTELTSNTALVAAMLPIAAALAQRLNAPAEALIVTATLAASLGFMLPMGTAPNALAYATGRVSMRQMAKAGLLLDALTVVLVPLVVWMAMKLGLLERISAR